MIEVLPTVVPESFEDIVRVTEAYKGFAKKIHIDVADGVFAPNTTWMPDGQTALPDGIEYEIHMMVADPHEVGLSYANSGAHALIGHAEAFDGADSAEKAFDAWHKAGIRTVETAALLQTPLESLSPYVPISDFILLMTIASIGVQGIPFEEQGIERVQEFRTLHPTVHIAVDGGVSQSNIERLAQAGATHFCVGSAISRAVDPAVAYRELLGIAESVEV